MKHLLAIGCFLFVSLAYSQAEKIVRASQFGYDRNNATACLQAAFDSDADTVIIDQVGSPWISGKLNINRDNLTIIFDEKVTLRALPGAFPERPDAFISVIRRKNITFLGRKDSLVTMNKEEYRQISENFQGGHRHAFRLMQNDGVTFKDMTITDSGGDGIYVGNGNRNVHIENTTCQNHARQGISVISCENLLIKNCHFDNTNGTPPQAGIDFEPNNKKECLVNCVVEDSTFNNNMGSGITAYLVNLDSSSRPVSITIRNCEVLGNNSGLMITPKRMLSDLLLGSIIVENCRIGQSKTVNSRVSDMGDGFSFAMLDSTIDNTGNQGEALTFTATSMMSPNIGNITVKNLQVLDDQPERPPVRFRALYGCGLGENVQVEVSRNGSPYDMGPDLATLPRGKDREIIELTKEKAVNLVVPATVGAISNPKVPTLNLRGAYTMLLQAKKGDQFSIWVRGEPVVAGRKPAQMTCQLKNPKNRVVETIEMMTDGTEKTITVTADLDGMYNFFISTAGQRASVWSDHPGQGLLVDKELALINPEVKLYFEVPAGLQNTMVYLMGASGFEIITKAALLNAAGEVVQTVENTEMASLKINRPANAPAEIWCLNIIRTVEDCSIMMGKGLKPIVATSPDLLLRSAK